MRVSARDFIHPEDALAQEQLRSLPLFDQFVKVFLRIGYEQLVHNLNMAEKIRLGPDQLPEIHRHLQETCRVLEVDEPELYLEMNPAPNAYAFGDTRVAVTLTSGLVEHCDEDELRAVIAHEVGHLVCRHTLYRTMAMLLKLAGSTMFGPLGIASKPIEVALAYWSRRGELSADRAGAVVLKGPKSSVETMIRLAGGPKSVTGTVNVDRYVHQADAVERLSDSAWNRVLQTWAVMDRTHPFASVRAREIRRWCETDHFARLVRAVHDPAGIGSCPACGGSVEHEWRFCRACGARTASARSGSSKHVTEIQDG